MRLHSHYRLAEARLLFVIAALAYAFATSTAPSLHSGVAEPADALRSHAGQVADGRHAAAHAAQPGQGAHVAHAAQPGQGAHRAAGQEGPFEEAPFPPGPDPHDDLDCLFCQVLGAGPHPVSPGAAHEDPDPLPPFPLRQHDPTAGPFATVRNARAPPSA